MKFKILISIFIIFPAVFIALSEIRKKPLAAAEDFPREALVYLQVDDLPAFIRLWKESKFKERYIGSENYREFTNSHLGLKLASRWQEFGDAAGFPFDLETVGGLTQTSAAVALYNIGKMDFVFIAPLSDEAFAAAKFVQNQDKFEEQELKDDGTIIYRVAVEADRGRQKQELIFAHTNGKFILATSEKLLAQTLKNINRKAGKNSLADEPSFKILSEKIEPHAAAAIVWVNQEKLNNDYYFKRYWLMSGASELKNIRAGIFDFSSEEGTGNLIERRKFLLEKAENQSFIKTPSAAANCLALLPENIPFYRLQAADGQNIQRAVRETIFERQKIADTKKNRRQHQYYSSFYDYYDDSYSQDYSAGSLSEEFDQNVDETDDDEEVSFQGSEQETDYAALLQKGNPQAVMTFTEPKVLPAPLFIEFGRGAVFNFASTSDFNAEAFESAVEKDFSSHLMISSPGVKLNWATKNDGGDLNLNWREISAPMTGWQIAYAVKGNELVLTNNSELLKKIFSARRSGDGDAAEKQRDLPQFNELTVLNLKERDGAFDRVFAQIVKADAASSAADANAGINFFTGNIKSLLDSAAGVESVEVRKSYAGNFLDEEVTLRLKKSE